MNDTGKPQAYLRFRLCRLELSWEWRHCARLIRRTATKELLLRLALCVLSRTSRLAPTTAKNYCPLFPRSNRASKLSSSYGLSKLESPRCVGKPHEFPLVSFVLSSLSAAWSPSFSAHSFPYPLAIPASLSHLLCLLQGIPPLPRAPIPVCIHVSQTLKPLHKHGNSVFLLSLTFWKLSCARECQHSKCTYPSFSRSVMQVYTQIHQYNAS